LFQSTTRSTYDLLDQFLQYPIPTWPMMLLGLAGIGFAGYCETKKGLTSSSFAA
jgi:hypothetical protein